MAPRHLIQRNVASIESLVGRMNSIGLSGGPHARLSWRAAQQVAGLSVWNLLLSQWQTALRDGSWSEAPAAPASRAASPSFCLGRIAG
eukprot:2535476-Alexandrium_andersonii.AAC.1